MCYKVGTSGAWGSVNLQPGSQVLLQHASTAVGLGDLPWHAIVVVAGCLLPCRLAALWHAGSGGNGVWVFVCLRKGGGAAGRT